MALPSQSGSRGSARAVRSKHRGLPRWLPIAGAAGLIAVIVWALWPDAGARTPETPAGQLAGELDDGQEPNHSEPDADAPRASNEPIDVLPPIERTPAPRPDAVVADSSMTQEPASSLSEAIGRKRAENATEREAPPEPARSAPTTTADTSTPAEPSAPPPARRVSPSAATAIVESESLLERGLGAEARDLLNEALLGSNEDDQRRLRERLSTLNEELIFSPTVYPNVWNTERYTVKGGDSLARIAYRNDLAIDWRLIQRVNRIANPNSIRVGQTLKLVRGPFHAVVDKSDYRLDVYHGAPDEPEDWVYIRSFAVGLGEHNATPTGAFAVRPDSKLVNPRWTNPRTGEQFEADDPENPIGERWIGLVGLGDAANFTGYGLHGTIDPGSIGQQRSMGCVRLDDDDVELMYELLEEGVSRVLIKD
ncbi:MAG: L,D-transpeptidase family protein [Planctomycetota bacterium]